MKKQIQRTIGIVLVTLLMITINYGMKSAAAYQRGLPAQPAYERIPKIGILHAYIWTDSKTNKRYLIVAGKFHDQASIQPLDD